MEIDFSGLDIDHLQMIRIKAENDLKEALLSGASWEEVQKKSELVVSLSILIDKKELLPGQSTPADHSFR
jgi:hypothetical protein